MTFLTYLVAFAHFFSEIAVFRTHWQDADARFGTVPGWSGERTAAPPLPGGRLRPRGTEG